MHDALLKDPAGLPAGDDALTEIRKQALIWRQLVTRDKEPEPICSGRTGPVSGASSTG